MANIATGFVRLFPKKGHLLPVGDILTLLCSWNGNSYHVPIVVRQNEFSLVTDFQFGDKYSAIHGNDDIWEKYATILRALWWRDYDDGGDHDAIGWRDEVSLTKADWCRYGYDKMRITWKPGKLLDDFGLPWDKQERRWTLAIKGSYQAGNDRCLLLLDQGESMPTPTTLTHGRPSDRLSWDSDAFEPLYPELMSACEENAETVAFFWKERLVRLQRPKRRRSETSSYIHCDDFCMDDWDNCVDQDWLVFNELSFEPDHI